MQEPERQTRQFSLLAGALFGLGEASRDAGDERIAAPRGQGIDLGG